MTSAPLAERQGNGETSETGWFRRNAGGGYFLAMALRAALAMSAAVMPNTPIR